ncbi:MAG: alpha-amylase/4-alpha-glucanotransferase domain-containing protein [Candidatus Margulisiibacteriota bacterium]
MKKINFLFGIHCHQPVGNFEHVFDQAYRDCYRPFIETLDRHPRIKFAAHWSGILYDWFLNKHPEFIDLLGKLVKRGQMELMTAGYYEPILPIIPDADKVGQIKMQSEFIKSKFKSSPRGLWLTERIWEPSLPKILSETGVEYVTVDDYHFFSAGLLPEELFGYYLTEDQGVTLKVFPINKKLRYLIPFKLPEETINYLRSEASDDPSRAAILADDGEKFGMWPGTHQWVFKENYLENLLSKIEANLDWIRPMTFAEYLDEYPAQGRVYLPTASYFEMMEWALPTRAGLKFARLMQEIERTGRAEEYKQFFKGGFFRNFFVKYEEANNMHKKMLQVSSKLQTIKKSPSSGERQDLIEAAQRDLYQGQCNCAYWHGVFGGLYLGNLRHAVYEHLIKAEDALQKIQRGNKKFTEVVVTDFDKDGAEEVLMANDLLNLFFSPRQGGGLFEIDYKPQAFNLANTLTRREEAYHQKIRETPPHNLAVTTTGTASIHDVVRVKEAGIQKYLVYDNYRKVSLLDHFFPLDISLDKVERSDYQEMGDFIGAEYGFFPHRKSEEAKVTFSRVGRVGNQPVALAKSVSLFSGASIAHLEYEIINQSDLPLSTIFGLEFNLTLLAGDAPDRYYSIPGKKLAEPKLQSRGEVSAISEVKLIDGWKGFSVSLGLEKIGDFWRYPQETVSQSEGGFERTFQGSVILFLWKLSLPPNAKWTNKIVFKIEEGV